MSLTKKDKQWIEKRMDYFENEITSTVLPVYLMISLLSLLVLFLLPPLVVLVVIVCWILLIFWCTPKICKNNYDILDKKWSKLELLKEKEASK